MKVSKDSSYFSVVWCLLLVWELLCILLAGD